MPRRAKMFWSLMEWLGWNRKPLKNVNITAETLQKLGKVSIVKGKG